MQGSGTFVIEPVISSAIAWDDKLLVIVKGAFPDAWFKERVFAALRWTFLRSRRTTD
jgi:aspartate aminotransferase-like enzyme